MKEQEITEVCTGLEYQRMQDQSFVIRYGEEGDRFYIILTGCVSVWVPMQHADMKAPLAKF